MHEKNKYTIVFLFLVIAFYSFAHVTNDQRDITGFYFYKSPTGGKAELNLYEDSSFVFITIEGMINDTVSGKWDFDRKKVTLIPNKLESYHRHEVCNSCQDKLSIKVNALDGEDLVLPLIELYAQDSLIKTGFLGSINLPSKGFDKIRISHVGSEPYWLNLKKMNNEMVIVYLKSEIKGILEQELTLKMKKEALIMSNGLELKKKLSHFSTRAS